LDRVEAFPAPIDRPEVGSEPGTLASALLTTAPKATETTVAVIEAIPAGGASAPTSETVV